MIEGLLYRSPHYDPSNQGVALSVDRRRPPAVRLQQVAVLESNAHLHLDLPFSDPGLDELFKMTRVPQPVDYMKERLDLEPGDDALFRSFLTEDTVAGMRKVRGRVT